MAHTFGLMVFSPITGNEKNLSGGELADERLQVEGGRGQRSVSGKGTNLG